MISHKYKFIFFHVPKTGGTSIRNMLLQNLGNDIIPFEKIDGFSQWLKNKGIFHLPSHTNAAHFEQFIGDTIFKTYFKFAVVRNPFDRLISLYFYTKQSEKDNSNPKSKFAQNIINSKSFGEWIRSGQLGMTQTSYVTSPSGKIIVDYIAKQEDLNSEFQYLCGKLGLPKIELNRDNKSKHSKQFLNYYDLDLMQIAYNLQIDDFKNFYSPIALQSKTK